MHINDELIAYLEELSRLRLTDEEKETAKTHLEDIIQYMDKLNEIDTTGLEGVSHPFTFTNAFRDDQRKPSSDREKILSSAPKQKDGCFMVPKTVE